jgi:hypothetical protein
MEAVNLAILLGATMMTCLSLTFSAPPPESEAL